MMEAVTASITSQHQFLFLFHEYTVCVVVCILTRMEVQCMHFSGRHSTSCLLCDWGQFKCIYLSPCWLPRINLLLLTSVESSCQNNKKSFPPPLVLISQQTLTFSSTEMWSIFLKVLSRLSFTNWINLSFHLHKKKS